MGFLRDEGFVGVAPLFYRLSEPAAAIGVSDASRLPETDGTSGP